MPATEEMTEQAAAAAAAEEPVKKKRATRAKKAADESAAEEAPKKATRSKAAADADAEEAKPKRKPGRPRKTETAEASAGEQDGAAADKVAVPASDAPAPAEEEKPKRKPGRPRKVKPAEDEATEAPSAEGGAEEAAAPADKAADGESSAADADGGQDRRRARTRQSDHRNQSQSQGGNGSRNGNNRYNNRNGQHRNRRERNGRQREYAPSVSKEELEACKLPELREKAAELNIDASDLRKAEMIDAIYEAVCIAEGFVEVEGILDILQDGYGFLRTKGYLPSEQDVYVGLSTIRRNGLRKGDMVAGQTRPAREGEKFAAIQKVTSINGTPIDDIASRPKFSDLTPIFPDERLSMEHGKDTLTARVIDLVAPIGKGQRGLIVSPPKAGKTTVLKDIAAAIHANNPEVHLMCLLVDERPEEVTDMERSIHGEVISSTFDMPSDNHIAVAELVIERAKRLVEQGEDVVILLDSITRLARAYNLAQPASGRILSGGVDSTALYPPKRFLGAARNIEGGGSLTILASALVDTGSKMDEVIFEEFKGTGNMELRLDRNLADRRIFPAIDPISSGTRKEDLLLDGQEAPLIWAVRRILANMNNTEKSMDMLIKSLKRTETNQEFILRTAKRAQNQSCFEENSEL